MAKKPTQIELMELRSNYLLKREQILTGRVNAMQAKLFDRVFDSYLLALQDKDGKLINSLENRNIIAGLDKVYAKFNKDINIPVVKSFLTDLNGVNDMNKSYFKVVSERDVIAESPQVKKVIDAQLGIKKDGSIKKGGYTDKFIRDETALKRIKKITTQAITSGHNFDTFRKNLKEYIEGNPKLQQSGSMQVNYKTYAYDTIQKVDAINQVEYGKRLKLKYFIYKGGIIKDSRNFCIHRNGKILESTEFAKLTYDILPVNQRDGIPATNWKPMIDRGGYNCRHSINFVSTVFAEQNKDTYNKAAIVRNTKTVKRFKS